ncbi:MAG: Shikimate dehydrogenase (NADP(+)) [Chlamydiae bacterium]|nr:Shikimate dehydrogenase (NADP(+)) [Chlamydiota bacterium]
MICVSLPGPTLEDLKKQIKEAQNTADFFELRCDLYPDLETIQRAFKLCSLPVILTCRRLEWIPLLAELGPEYMDLDHTVPFQVDCKIIRSYHNYDETPQDLDSVLSNLTQYPADIYKIATQSTSILDSLRLLKLAQSTSVPLTVVGMGELGECTRIMAPVFGCPIVYASPNSQQTTAPGQIPAETLVKTYYHHQLNQETQLYGLIGDPVAQSIGHIYHNNYMKDHNALYVRLRVTEEELAEFLPLATNLGFCGFSVTMPHKENILSFLHQLDSKAHSIGAVNTIAVKETQLMGMNTDADGALDALEAVTPVEGKTLVLLGAGGSSRAIAFEAIRRGARVMILNRTPEKAIKLANHLGCCGGSLGDLEKISYDILINTTPHSCPIDHDQLKPNSLVMDLSITPRETVFLKVAQQKAATTVDGHAMFEKQAAAQRDIWFS